MNDMNRQFVGVWQHRTSGERYIVESDLDFNVLAAVGPVNHADIATMLDTGDWVNDPELAADLNAHADEYRTLADDDLVAFNLRGKVDTMTPDKYTFTNEQLRELLYGTIQMFQEYRDVHGRTEEAAKFEAVGEMFEGLDAERELLASGDIARLTLQLPVEVTP